MARYDRKDRFYKKAKEEGRASRAFFKLDQIQEKYKIVKKGDRVVDLGCAPGGWLQVAAKLVGNGGRVFGVDILPVKIGGNPNITFLQADINDGSIVDAIRESIGDADCVLSDMAPSTSGVKFKDSYFSYELASRALEIARTVLKKGGNFVAKIFPGEEFAGFKKELALHFDKVHQYRPEATRKSSIEVYLVGIGFSNRNGVL